MLKKLMTFPEVVTLVPGSGIQFLDFGLKITAVGRINRAFWPEVLDGAAGDGGERVVHLHPLVAHGDDHVYFSDEYPNGRLAPPDEIKEYRAGPALSVFDGEWLPIPVLRVLAGGARDVFDKGPVGWARVRVRALSQPDLDGNTHRVVMAFDTNLGAPRRDGAPYLAPEPRDAADPVEFQLVADPAAIGFFLESQSVRRWLKDRFLACAARARGRAVLETDIEPGEYWAQYILLLDAIAAGCAVPRVKLIDTVSSPDALRPIEVDLVIDVGNSRTCGILIERDPNGEQVDIGKATRLELRDLTHPELAHTEPFSSRVEFSPVQFGSYQHARRTSQAQAFWWPSLVRVGPEAAWLAAQSDGTEGITGLSSPKRYLWDVAARAQPWSNTRGAGTEGGSPPEIKGPMTAELTESGELIGGPGRTVGTSPRYSRSSLYTLMLVELLSHATAQINSVSARGQSADRNIPRRLGNLILTLPSATPLAEQKVLRRRAREAWELLARIMRWPVGDPLHKAPRIRMDWDEATCTHLVYLHNEINRKYMGQPSELFTILGRGRTGARGGPTLRIASLDIGGGTTDLMIIDHEVEGQRIIHPRQVFREGFRLAGDDVLKTVIEEILLPAVVDHLREAGVSSAFGLINDLFGGDRDDTAQQDRMLRANFTNQVWVTAALGLLSAYEATDGRRAAPEETLRLGDLFPADRRPEPHVRAYLETEVRRRGAPGFSLDDVTLRMNPIEMAGVVSSVLQTMIEDLSDVVRAYDCDLLLLSGRPSRLPIVGDLLNANMPVPPHRLIAMHKYKVFNWYPFRSNDFRISDPKTTAVVGAMLCLICEGRMEGFHMKSGEIKMRSTARYIGLMNQRGEITPENVLLENVDLDSGEGVVGFTVAMEGPIFIGFRQLNLARWKTQPLFFLSVRDPDKSDKLVPPIKIRMERDTLNDDDDESALEVFKVVDAVDAMGKLCRNDISFRVQTLRTEKLADSGYWLDSGVLRAAERR